MAASAVVKALGPAAAAGAGAAAAMAEIRERRKLARIAEREAQAQRAHALLTDPRILGLGTMFLGIYAANRIRWDEDPTRNRDMRAMVMAGTAIGSLSLMGVHDKYIQGGMALGCGLSGLDPVKIPSPESLTENYGMGADARLFGQSVPGVTPGTSAWEWLLGPLRYPYNYFTRGSWSG